MLSRTLSVIMCAVLVMSSVALLAQPGSRSETPAQTISGGGSFGGGDGTALTPYIIEDVLDLQNMSANLTANYTLGNDIDATNTSVTGNPSNNGGLGFEPIARDTDDGTFNFQGTRFTGVLNGTGYVIRGLYINRPGRSFIGLFGSIEIPAAIQNVTLVEGNVTGESWVGMLIGENLGVVAGCSASGTVSSTATFGTGGLIGSNNGGGQVSDCSAMAEVNGLTYLGGLIGYNSGGALLTTSYAAGDITGTSTLVGGLVGYQNGGTISNCYALGNVIGTSGVGGLIGGLSGSVTNCYSTGTATGTANYGGFYGDSGAGTFTNCYWDNETSATEDGVGNIADPPGIWGNYTSEMMQQATYVGWDFATTWWMIENETRPFLQMEYSTIVTNSHQLQMMQMSLAADYKLANDVDLSDVVEPSQMWGTSPTSGEGFRFVGNLTSFFTGSLDGRGHGISGLHIKRTATDYVGLFGVIATLNPVSNLSLIDCNVSGNNYVGGLVGFTSPCMISNCNVTGKVNGTGERIGGIVGYHSGTITNCFAVCDVNGFSGVGAVVGANFGGNVDNCSAAGNMSGSSVVGGLVGNNGGPVTNCHATCNVSSGGNNAGGLLGYNGATVSGSTASGRVSGSAFYAGGLVGQNSGTITGSVANCLVYSSGTYSGCFVGHNSGTITGCNASGVTNSTGTYVGGFVGSNIGQMSDCIAHGDVVDGGVYSGGFAGYNNGGALIFNCTAHGNVTYTDNYRGGLVGRNVGMVENCTAYGYTEGPGSWVGGLVGDNFGTAIVSNCSAYGNASGNTYIGGLAGNNEASAMILNSSSSGKVTATGNYAGGLVGYNAGTVYNSTSSSAVSGQG
ncbi:MAG: hypothetical protein HZB92_03620 [Euryarchaeota archaeon]|nr:hypothetical protein [Euryarchaeota archaeon]